MSCTVNGCTCFGKKFGATQLPIDKVQVKLSGYRSSVLGARCCLGVGPASQKARSGQATIPHPYFVLHHSLASTMPYRVIYSFIFPKID